MLWSVSAPSRFSVALCGVVLLACEPSAAPPPLDPPPSRAPSTLIRVAGVALATPLIAHLARHFMALHPGAPLIVEAPLGHDGALRAVRDGVLDMALLALRADEAGLAGAVAIAESPIVVAAGPGVPLRRMSHGELAAIIREPRGEWPTGLPRTVLLRPANDPAQGIVSRAVPVIGRAVEASLTMRRWPVIHNDDALRDALRRTPGAVALTDLGSLRLVAAPLWILPVGDLEPGRDPHGLGRLRVWALPRENAAPRLRAFLEFAAGAPGRALVADLGFIPPAESP